MVDFLGGADWENVVRQMIKKKVVNKVSFMIIYSGIKTGKMVIVFNSFFTIEEFKDFLYMLKCGAIANGMIESNYLKVEDPALKVGLKLLK